MLFYKIEVINDDIILEGTLTLSKALLHNRRKSGPSIEINVVAGYQRHQALALSLQHNEFMLLCW
jgi:hypothetical protein